MTVCKSAVLLHYINYNSAMLFFLFFSMAFDRCSINDYLLTYLLNAFVRFVCVCLFVCAQRPVMGVKCQ